MVDIQDARWGPDTYDLASLLYDAYIDIDPEWIPELIDVFLDTLPDPPPKTAFVQRLNRVATQRMIKALGTFARQVTQTASPSFQTAIDRTLPRLNSISPNLPNL
jgi:aminoglycoside/choline kinase family phosphotransferase